MPRTCSCSTFCAAGRLCRKRKQFEDNILLVANENSVDSLDILEDKNKNKTNSKLLDDNTRNESDDSARGESDNERSKSVSSDDEKSKTVSTSNSETESFQVSDEELDSLKPTTSNRKVSEQPSVFSEKKYSTTEAIVENDAFAIYLTHKLQAHVDKEFEFVEEEYKRIKEIEQMSSRSSSMSRIQVDKGTDPFDTISLDPRVSKNEGSFLNKFRSKLSAGQSHLKLKERKDKLKQMIIKKTNEINTSISNSNKKDKNQQDKKLKESKVFGGEKNHKKYHPNFDAKT